MPFAAHEKRIPLKVWGSCLRRAGSKIVKDVQPFGALSSSSRRCVKWTQARRMLDVDVYDLIFLQSLHWRMLGRSFPS